MSFVKFISPSYHIILSWNLESLYAFLSWIHENWVCINRTSVAWDIEVGMDKGRHRQITRFDFEGCNFHSLPYFISFYLIRGDATILFDSFIHIYLVFCICFVYKMSWYSLFYVLKVFLDERCKKEVIRADWQIWPAVGVLSRVEALEIEMKWFQYHSKSNIHKFM